MWSTKFWILVCLVGAAVASVIGTALSVQPPSVDPENPGIITMHGVTAGSGIWARGKATILLSVGIILNAIAGALALTL